MALPAPATTATLLQLAVRGWPLLAAVLLTLLLGWSALHEGRGGTHPPSTQQLQGSLPPAPAEGLPQEQAMPRGEAESSPGRDGGHNTLLRRLCLYPRTPPPLLPPASAAPSLHRQLSGRRLPPAQAPPLPLA